MDANTKRQIKALEKLRLPELQARFAEVIGEPNRSPNRNFLIRRITEALTAQASAPHPGETIVTAASTTAAVSAATAPAAPRAPTAPARPGRRTTAATRASGDTSRRDASEPRLSQLSVEELQAKYAEAVGRPTGSEHKGYLLWKIRQAQKGQVRVGPARRRSSADPADFKVLPLRLESNAVEQLDAARERIGLPNRTELFRRALQLYLKKAGEPEVAALFAAPAEA
ncbi:MAG: ribbon-helix-helix protein, CopG family [Polyangia bacterium]|jgi:hypothetical protein|nr:ribbon-helix-helix protein, CopG family [Polyangia bacterium]